MAKRQAKTSKARGNAKRKAVQKKSSSKQSTPTKKPALKRAGRSAQQRGKPLADSAAQTYSGEGSLADRVTIKELKDAGFFAYAKASMPALSTLSYGGTGLGAAYKVTDETGKSHGVQRVFGADVEELVEHGLSWFFTDNLSHLGIDPSSIEERFDGERREWCYGDSCYVIPGDSSAYDRAAFALVAILNQILEESGSEERAYGVNEGNAFGVAFLTEALFQIISSVADDDEKPVLQEQLRKTAEDALSPKEPPLVTPRR